MAAVIVAGERDVRGVKRNGVEAYLGIPYAAAPVGELRQQPPAPPTPWTGDRDATQYGPTARKRGYASPYDELLPEPHIEGDEYLNLNIWTPSRTGSLPVFVWIHGGAFVNGSGAVSLYDGSAFARDGVVCVTINYRLGVEGFLDPGEGVTNLGLRDQIAALEWVRDNIAGFGGDPSRVTIGGESAGGMSVACLLSSPKAKGLFRGAIMQSGAGHHAVTRDNAKLITGELAKRLGVEPTREAIANAPIEQILDAQIDMSAEIQAMPDPARWGEMVLSMMAFQPVVDGEVLPKLPIRSIEGGAGADVNVLIGANTDENLLFMAPSGALGAIDAEMLTGAAMGYGLSEEALAIYRANRPDSSPGEVLAALATDWMFRIPAIRLAEARAESAGNTYVYEFAWRSTARDGILGACHALEIPFAFDTLDAEETTWITGEAPPQLLADEMHRSWVRFISEGEPGWDEYGEARTTMRFDEEPQVVTDLRPDERVAWNGVR